MIARLATMVRRRAAVSPVDLTTTGRDIPPEQDAPSQDAPTPAGAPPTCCHCETAVSMLARWLELSELERRAFLAMTRELTTTSDVVERSTLDLSQRFQTLAKNAREQLQRVAAVTELARSIHVAGQEMTLSEATKFIEEVLVKVVDTVLMVSKTAMRMVYSLDDLTREVTNAEQCVTQLRSINRQIRFLALNAAIEAARAGDNGGPFQVIAREINALANETDSSVGAVNAFIEAISGSVDHSRALLREVATVDMTDHIIAKEKLNALLEGMTAQNRDFNAILSETASASTQLSDTIAPLVMGLQFQDRTAQHLAHVVEALGSLGDVGSELRRATHAALPQTFAQGDIDPSLLTQLLDKQTLGDVRRRFLAHLIGNDPDVATAAGVGAAEDAADGGEIDLF